MTVLLLRLAAPLQSWGTSSRFVRRNTDRAPSRSGIIGLLAAAQGRAREDPLEDLRSLIIGVRIDQPGTVERDFQTARTQDGNYSMPLSYRFYLADAVFVTAIGGEADLLDTLLTAIKRPHFPLYLGRRSCPPAGQLLHGLRNGEPASVLATEAWMASPHIRNRHHSPTIDLDVVLDAAPDDPSAQLVRDDPLSFDPRHRRYGWRTITQHPVSVPNPAYRGPRDHDPMAALEELA